MTEHRQWLPSPDLLAAPPTKRPRQPPLNLGASAATLGTGLVNDRERSSDGRSLGTLSINHLGDAEPRPVVANLSGQGRTGCSNQGDKKRTLALLRIKGEIAQVHPRKVLTELPAPKPHPK